MKKKPAVPARYCRRCGRKLKNAQSISAGIGPKCKKIIEDESAPRQLLLFGDEEEEEG
jgi:hypothetical protein